MLIMCFPVYLDFGHGQLENEVAKVLFTTVFFFFIQKGTPSTGWLYFGNVNPMVCMSCTINHTQQVWINLGLGGLGLSKVHQLHHFGLYKSWTQFDLVLFVAKTLHKFRLKMGLINLDTNNPRTVPI